MASELRVNTLKDAAGNNSIPMSSVSPGVPKSWCHWNGNSTVKISLNVSSITDSSTGIGIVNWSSAQENANYSCTTSNVAVSAASYVTCIMDNTNYVTRTTTAWSYKSAYSEGDGDDDFFDSASAVCSALGDLA